MLVFGDTVPLPSSEVVVIPTSTVRITVAITPPGAGADPGVLGAAIAQKLRERLLPPLEKAIGDIAHRDVHARS